MNTSAWTRSVCAYECGRPRTPGIRHILVRAICNLNVIINDVLSQRRGAARRAAVATEKWRKNVAELKSNCARAYAGARAHRYAKNAATDRSIRLKSRTTKSRGGHLRNARHLFREQCMFAMRTALGVIKSERARMRAKSAKIDGSARDVCQRRIVW